jgi:hypothetical protein
MAHDFTSAYAAIIKADENEDGTMTVYGKATDDSIDSDNQICDATWLDRAMPEWMKSGGNIREQHSNIAAGVATELESKSDGHYISALVVDPVSVKKVKAGVLKGFSIGIKAPRVVRDQKAANGRIIDGQIIEVSLVDRPANPNAKLIMAKSVEGEPTLTQVEEFHEYSAPLPTDLFKREVSDTERERLADRGAAMPDGSYPIANVEDLKNAIQAFGRAKNPAKVKQHIIRRARALGATNLLPEKWTESMKKAEQIIERAKAVGADLSKFDQATFDAARTALAQLFIVEAQELAQGEDERDSFEHLLDALDGLMDWYENEADEGEVAPSFDGQTIEMSAKADDCDCKCDKCMKSEGCDSKECKCASMKSADLEPDAEKSVHKCLECGCNLPAEDHGRDDVTTAEMVDPQDNAGSEDEEKDSEDDASEKSATIESIVELAVKSAMKSVEAEIASLKSAKEAAEEKSVKLETELATALTKTVAGGPKRTATKYSNEAQNDLLVKAMDYKAKADASTDPLLVKGYLGLYADFMKKAGKDVVVAVDDE